MLQIYVTLWRSWFVCVCVCVCVCVSVYLVLLSHFQPFKIHLTNILPILIKMVDFKNLACATSFATQASRKFIYLPFRASGKKSYCHTLSTYLFQVDPVTGMVINLTDLKLYINVSKTIKLQSYLSTQLSRYSLISLYNCHVTVLLVYTTIMLQFC